MEDEVQEQEAPEEVQDTGSTEEVSEPVSAPEPEEEVIQAPDWLEQFLSPRQPSQPQEKPVEQKKPEFDKELIDEETAKVIDFLQNRIQELEQKTDMTSNAFMNIHQRQVHEAVSSTVDSIRRNAYQGVFAKDTDFRSDPDLRQVTDGFMQMWLNNSIAQAEQYGDTSQLRFVNHPRFPNAVLGMVKGFLGKEQKPSVDAPVQLRGAEVETSRKKGEAGAAPRITKSMKKAMKQYGISESELADAMKYASDFESYDVEEE